MTTIFNTYNKVSRRTGTIALSLSLLLTASSCSGFLEILPPNDVVLENYWTEKNDVTSVLFSCYESLESEESMLRMGVWGELRSDNITPGRTGSYDIQEMLKENILPTSSLVKWDVMYQTINRCNTVCHFAPSVQGKDPNYSPDELNANIAEAVFIRDLCYFYLLRTFRDVPITFEASLDDQRDYRIPPTKFENGIDTLIADLRKVEGYAVHRYVDDTRMQNREASRSAYENNSRVTCLAIYALLADLNLWRGNYSEVVKYSDLVLDYKKEQYKKMRANLGNINDMYEFNGIPLILDKPEGNSNCGNMLTEIFGDKNSFESLFELYFCNANVTNSYISDYYGTASQKAGFFNAPSTYRKDVAEGKNVLFDKRDGRAYGSILIDNTSYRIAKYATSSVTFDNQNITDEKSAKVNSNYRGDNYANWIIYRLTDVMLMKAEALILMGEDNYEEAFNLISAVNCRARSIKSATDKDALKFPDYNTPSKIINLLLDERNREFMYEGKRWYDLVRFSLRDGNTHTLVSKVTSVEEKYRGSNANAIKIKLSDPNIIFLPYYRDELKLNDYLKQNPAYGNTEEFVQ
ncbi:MAG: RagB/SusD family nutrient uptake outer membrane protein [Bacteroidaceae bacterium]|nr:RagB/SusD family nutrient uptake outer membrane protein [Bacteroidaceae bacterium]